MNLVHLEQYKLQRFQNTVFIYVYKMVNMYVQSKI